MKSRWNQALVVSNNIVHRTMLEFNLAKHGFVVTLAMNAKEAFLLAEKHHFGLVITDFQTPQGAGVDLARQLRFLGPYDETPLVLLADERDELDLDYVRNELWMLVIREPCNLTEVVEKIAAFYAPEQSAC
ncbi:MAG: response regulator [Pirellulales bacterium]|nr:response regulator [Pirellulales bacterium]